MKQWKLLLLLGIGITLLGIIAIPMISPKFSIPPIMGFKLPAWLNPLTIIGLIINLFSLYKGGRESQRKENRELVEKLYGPLKESMKKMTDPKVHSNNYTDNILRRYWKWPQLQTGNHYLAPKIDEKLRKGLEEFSNSYENYISLRQDHVPKLNCIIDEEIRKHVEVSYSSPTDVECGIGQIRINLYDLVFARKNLDEYLEKKEIDIGKAELQFLIRGIKGHLDAEDFREIHSCIKRRLEGESEIQKLLEEADNIISQAKLLEKELERVINKAVSL